MHRWTDSAAGGMSQRLNPGGATVRSRSRNLNIGRRMGSRLPEVSEQVGDALHAERLLEALGHQRAAAGAELLDLGAEHGLLSPLGAAELEAGIGLLDEQAREDLAALGDQEISHVIGGHF